MRARLFPILLVLFSAGCGTVALNVAYEPPPASPRLSGERLPRIFVDDASVTASMDIAMSWNRDAEWSPPPEQAVRDALRAELSRLGFPAASDPRSADAVLHATLTQCEFEMPRQAAPVARLAISLALRTPDGAPLWESALTGRGRADRVWVDADQARDALSRALTAAVLQLGGRLDSEGVPRRVFAGAPAPAKREPAAAAPAAVVRSDVDDPPARRAPRPRAHAVLFGVRRYQQALPEAEFADADAALVRRYLSAFGYEDAEIALAVDEQATKSAVEKYVEAWLPNRVEAGDEVVVYFSGHGAPNPRTGDAYLVPYDGDPTYLDKTAYPLKRLYAQLAKLPAAKITVILDSCFSGAGGRSVLAKGARPLVTVDAGRPPERVSVMTASTGDQISYSLPDKGHGLFTYHLLRALRGQSGPEPDLRAAFERAARDVTAAARRDFNADQTPVWRGR